MRVWIEINVDLNTDLSSKFHPLMRVWIEMLCLVGKPYKVPVSPSYEGVD